MHIDKSMLLIWHCRHIRVLRVVTRAPVMVELGKKTDARPIFMKELQAPKTPPSFATTCQTRAVNTGGLAEPIITAWAAIIFLTVSRPPFLFSHFLIHVNNKLFNLSTCLCSHENKPKDQGHHSPPPSSPSRTPWLYCSIGGKCTCLSHNKSPTRLPMTVMEGWMKWVMDDGVTAPCILTTGCCAKSGTHEKWWAEGAQSTTKPSEGVCQAHKVSQSKQWGLSLLAHVYNDYCHSWAHEYAGARTAWTSHPFLSVYLSSGHLSRNTSSTQLLSVHVSRRAQYN